jgi:hypothetical protein
MIRQALAAEPDRRATAVRIGRDYPYWLVMWGAYSRQFWAYPLFDAPRGTIVHSANPDELARAIQAMQISMTARPGTRITSDMIPAR